MAIFKKSVFRVLLLTNVEYGNILYNFVFQHFRAEVKFTVVVIIVPAFSSLD